ncbi:hypothetical protein NQ314_000543, partial [Rhamnusium bicolor]
NLMKSKLIIRHRGIILKHQYVHNDNLTIHKLIFNFKTEEGSHYRDFVSFATSEMYSRICNKVETATRDETASLLWHELRYARITA